MTLLGWQRKTAVAALAVFMNFTGAPPALPGTTERIVTDRHSGLALFGFDPVAYFTDALPMIGRAEFELYAEGVAWRFRNEGNRAAFAAHPEIYMPQFGGYDPIALGRGAPTPGYPEHWFIFDQRLYLFHSAFDRDAFARDPQTAVTRAREQWDDVLKKLVP
jgi:hypothetical protein